MRSVRNLQFVLAAKSAEGRANEELPIRDMKQGYIT
jgi:hypothetical protein